MGVEGRVRQDRFESRAQRAMVSLLVAAGRVGCELDALCMRHGVTHHQYNVLRILRGVHPDGHPRCEIVDRLIDRSPDVTRLLDRLERADLVERYRSDADRRYSFARITAAGLELLEAMEPEIRAMHDRFRAPFSDDELGMLAGLCGRVALDE